ncbi:MAG: penicillin-binding transpeptidase domain-containing protein [Desulfocucumaceae bacterium]
MAPQLFHKKRLAIVFVLIACFFVALLFRLSWLQLVRGEELSRKATEVRAKDEVLDPKRGIIYDRNHIELVGNYPVKSIYLNPDIFSFKAAVSDVADKKEKEKALKEKIVKEISAILELDEAATLKVFESGKSYAWLKHRVDYTACKKLEDLLAEYKITGIGFVDGSMRSYPQGTMAAHVLGFVGMDQSARGGLEKVYNNELTGSPGRLVTEADAWGRDLPQTKTGFNPSVPGKNLILTIDQTIQFYVERELDKVDEMYKPSKATVIVMDPSSGEVLAMGSRPTYNPSKYNSYPQQVWDFNPALHYNYEPGSTLKMFVAAMALEEGTVRESDSFYDPGYIVVRDRKIRCWDVVGHGAQSFAEGVQNSCNPVFITVGLRSGKELMYKYLKGFGFGQRTGVDMPGEEAGLIIPEEKISEVDLATMSIGQSVAVTPIQLITAMSSLANGGTLLKPHLVKGFEDQDSGAVTNVEPQVVRQVISKGTTEKMARLLQKVVLEGSGKKAYVEGYAVAGKTGTAQVPGQGGYDEGKYVASFAGFVPAENPRIAVLVMISEPKGGKFYGSEVAAPVFQAVARDTLHYLSVQENHDLPHPKEDQPSLQKAQIPEGVKLVQVPNVLGFPVEDARSFLEERGLRPGVAGKAGLVAEQSPAGGAQTQKGNVVSLGLVAINAPGLPVDVLVPDMRGLSIRRAGSILRRLDLNFALSGSGLAISQNPRPGERVAKGTLVTVEFAPPKK